MTAESPPGGDDADTDRERNANQGYGQCWTLARKNTDDCLDEYRQPDNERGD